ncbi:AP2/ERF family transcription factor [Arcticibacter sp.]|uniref:AP2/ERF family transcription factor n=1 Tax=Arcticibacter sp. TaxID=1872630 RepID=UPI00388E0ED3
MAKEITLTQGKVAIVDDSDYEYLSKYKWYTKNNNGFFYAVRTDRSVKPRRTIFMHRLVMNEWNSKTFIDHKDHDTLNNQKANLRACCHAENMRNGTKTSKLKTSVFKGVSKRVQRRNGKVIYTAWLAQVGFEGKRIQVGLFQDEVEAAKAYDKAALKYFGQYANLNFKDHGQAINT